MLLFGLLHLLHRPHTGTESQHQNSFTVYACGNFRIVIYGLMHFCCSTTVDHRGNLAARLTLLHIHCVAKYICVGRWHHANKALTGHLFLQVGGTAVIEHNSRTIGVTEQSEVWAEIQRSGSSLLVDVIKNVMVPSTPPGNTKIHEFHHKSKDLTSTQCFL